MKTSNALKKTVTLLNNFEIENAYQQFCNEVEIDEIEGYNDGTDNGEYLAEFAAQYDAGNKKFVDVFAEEEVEEEIKPKRAAPSLDSEYYESLPLNMIDKHIDAIYESYDSDIHVNYRFRLERGATNIDRAEYLNEYFHAAVDLFADDGTHPRFARLIRHQICMLTKGNDKARKKFLKDIPTEAEVIGWYE